MSGSSRRARSSATNSLCELERLANARRQNGIDRVGGNTVVTLHDLGARNEELNDLFTNGVRVEFDAVGSIGGQGGVDGGHKVELEVVARAKHGDDAERATAQGERVGRTGGSLVDGEKAANGVKLVGNGDDLAYTRRGRIVSREARAIVVGDEPGRQRRSPPLPSHSRSP